MLRGCIALVLAVLTGCQTTKRPVNNVTRAQLPSSAAYVTVVRLADDLDLDYRPGEAGLIALTSPPDNVMLVPDSRRALVNGEEVCMGRPCMMRGDDYILASEDAAVLTRTLNDLRASRRGPEPIEIIVPPSRPAPTRTTGFPARWQPSAGVEAGRWKYIVIHHMASERGSAAIIHRMHRERGWEGLGYHFVIGNGSLTRDGEIEVGYRWRRQEVGAHARARNGDDNRWNVHGIGICLIGDFRQHGPSAAQLDALTSLVRALRQEYGISVRNVVPHRFVRATECPGSAFPWDEFIERIR